MTAAYAFPLDIPTALTRDESALLQQIAEEFHNETGANMTVVDRLAVFQ